MKTYITLDNIELVEIDGETNNIADGYNFDVPSDYLEKQIKIFNKENNQDYTINNMFGIYFDDYLGQSHSLLPGDYLLVAKDITPDIKLGHLSYAVVENGELVGTVVKVIRNQFTAEEIAENRNTNKGVK